MPAPTAANTMPTYHSGPGAVFGGWSHMAYSTLTIGAPPKTSGITLTGRPPDLNAQIMQTAPRAPRMPAMVAEKVPAVLQPPRAPWLDSVATGQMVTRAMTDIVFMETFILLIPYLIGYGLVLIALGITALARPGRAYESHLHRVFGDIKRPLAGVEGVLVQHKTSKGLLVVSIDLLQRSVAVEIDCVFVAPVSSSVPVRGSAASWSVAASASR